MPFRDSQTHLHDILQSIDRIDSFVSGIGFEDYVNDPKTQSAIERQLQILTEAAVRLGDDGERLCPGIEWKGFRGMGNILRHEYHRIDNAIVWDTVKMELPPLRIAVLAALT